MNGQNITSLVFLIAFAVFFWFVILRPQQKQRRQWQDMVSSLKKGQGVITRGGIHGVITEIKDNVLKLQIADKVEITLSRSAVAEVIKTRREAEPADSKRQKE